MNIQVRTKKKAGPKGPAFFTQNEIPPRKPEFGIIVNGLIK
jgi:hypothetical protein